MIEPFSPRRPRSRARPALWAGGAVLALLAAAVVTAVLVWPHVALARDGNALARVAEPGYAGSVSRVVVRDAGGRLVPVALRDHSVWPTGSLPVGEPLTVAVTVRRPGWAGWLVGRSETRRFVVRTPSARLVDRWLRVAAGAAVTVAFVKPVRVVSLRVLGRQRVVRFAAPRANVQVGPIARGARRTGSLEISAAPRSWEQLPPPVRVTWFPAGKQAQALVEPAAGASLAPADPITLTFSQPIEKALGKARPTITPAAAGRWQLLDTHTLSFRPAGLGYPLGSHLEVRLPKAVGLARRPDGIAVRSLAWQVRDGTTLRLQQLLARAGYLPLDWEPDTAIADDSAPGQLSAAVDPPRGRFQWRYGKTPRELRTLWRAGRANAITRAAVMMFEHDHALDVDGFVGPKVWQALLTDALGGKRRSGGYSYVYVHRSVPQSLNLWHNGHVILRSPGNTGVPAAPTQLGSFPVFEHIPVGTMSGTNPDGTRYHDPGIRYISYFNHGDAIHAFNRASFGTPQSLGCVELPLAAARKVWPYTPIGTLVTVEN